MATAHVQAQDGAQPATVAPMVTASSGDALEEEVGPLVSFQEFQAGRSSLAHYLLRRTSDAACACPCGTAVMICIAAQPLQAPICSIHMHGAEPRMSRLPHPYWCSCGRALQREPHSVYSAPADSGMGARFQPAGGRVRDSQGGVMLSWPGMPDAGGWRP